MLIRTPRDLGAAIRDRRQQRGWSQRELAERVGASRQWVNAVEKGKARTEVGLALRALDALDVTLRLDRDDRANDEDDGLDIDAIDIDKIVDSARGEGAMTTELVALLGDREAGRVRRDRRGAALLRP